MKQGFELLVSKEWQALGMEKDLELPPAHVASAGQDLTKTCNLEKNNVLTCNSAALSDMSFIRNECPVNEKP